jgi:hypothetical protein
MEIFCAGIPAARDLPSFSARTVRLVQIVAIMVYGEAATYPPGQMNTKLRPVTSARNAGSCSGKRTSHSEPLFSPRASSRWSKTVRER